MLFARASISVTTFETAASAVAKVWVAESLPGEPSSSKSSASQYGSSAALMAGANKTRNCSPSASNKPSLMAAAPVC